MGRGSDGATGAKTGRRWRLQWSSVCDTIALMDWLRGSEVDEFMGICTRTLQGLAGSHCARVTSWHGEPPVGGKAGSW